MKKSILPAVVLSLVFLCGCEGEKVITPNRADVNAPNTNAEIAQEANANLIPAKNMPSVNANSNQLVPALVPTNANVKAAPISAPAPFDSSIVTTMDKNNRFLETRTFRSDPLIRKIERIQQLKKITIFLKNGKAVELPYDKGQMLFTGGSPQDLLTAAGIKPPTAPPSVNPGKVEQSTGDAVKKSSDN
jgi:hypothetical protein